MVDADKAETGRQALLRVTQTRDPDGCVRLVLAGELDLSTTEIVNASLEAVGGDQGVTLDLRDVVFIDCAGIGCLLRWVRHARAGNLALRVERPQSPQTERLLALTGAELAIWPQR